MLSFQFQDLKLACKFMIDQDPREPKEDEVAQKL